MRRRYEPPDPQYALVLPLGEPLARQPPRGSSLAPDGQADGACRRCDHGCDPTRRSRARLIPGIRDDALAADRTGRRFRGLDIDPAYVDAAIDTWSERPGLVTRVP